MRAAAESAPITMTSLQFTHAQGLGYTDACIECHCQYRLKYMHGHGLASSPGHFPPPTWPRSI